MPLNLDRLEKWADRNLIKFNKDKCKVLHLGKRKPFATAQAGDWLVGKQLCGKGPCDSGGQQAAWASSAPWAGRQRFRSSDWVEEKVSPVRTVKQWKRLTRKVVQVLSLEIFKTNWKALRNLVWLYIGQALSRKLDLKPAEIPPNLDDPVILQLSFFIGRKFLSSVLGE